MSDLRPVLFIQGLLVCIIGTAMLFPMLADFLAQDSYDALDLKAFGLSAAICIVLGGGISLATWSKYSEPTLRQNFLISGTSWIVLTIFGALPLMLGNYELSFTDAIFEVVSGLTTTGATILTDLDSAPSGLLLWRSILHFIGGIGIILMAIAVLPMLSVGGMQLFKLQTSDTTEKPFAATSKIAAGITFVYTGLTLSCSFAYWLMGMSAFDALNHGMSTIATGGFSTHDASFGYFYNNGSIHGPLILVSSIFMVMSALPFGLYLLAVNGKPGALFRDSQVRFYIGLILAVITILTGILLFQVAYPPIESVSRAGFNAISIITGTGFALGDYTQWGYFASGLFFCLTFIGGCAGSASCGLKVFRFQIALQALTLFGKRLVHPNGVFTQHYNDKPLTGEIYQSVMVYFFVYFVVFASSAVLLSLLHLDPLTALSASAAAIACVGPGLGEIVGPSGNYQSLPDAAKWILAVVMLLGRLEFFTLLVFFAPSFWRR